MRLISVVAALALVVAHVVGGYAHAAGHDQAKGHASCLHQHISAVAADKVSQHDDSEHGNGVTVSIDALDFMCCGGLAILVTPSFDCTGGKVPHASNVPCIAHLLLPASLERPPKSTVRA